MPTDRYVPKHRAVKRAVLNDWKRLTALGATLPTALATLGAVTAPAEAVSKREQKIQNAVRVARNQKDDVYDYGSNGPERFDCSGLLQYSFGKAGMRLPRTSDAQADKARRIKKSNLRVGDLIVFTDGGDVYHIGVYTGRTDSGKRRLVQAANAETDVNSAGVWTNDWYAATLRRR